MTGIMQHEPLVSGSLHLTWCLHDSSTSLPLSTVHSSRWLINMHSVDMPYFVHPLVTFWASEMLVWEEALVVEPHVWGVILFLSVKLKILYITDLSSFF